MPRIITTIPLCIVLLLNASAFGGRQDSKLKDITDSKYKVGQLWSYRTRPGEEGSTFIVVKTENNPTSGNIIHIAVQHLKIKNPHGPNGISDTVNHLPFSEVAINKSAMKLLKEKVDLPDFMEGYQTWRKAFEAGTGGVYEITVAEAITAMEASVNR